MIWNVLSVTCNLKCSCSETTAFDKCHFRYAWPTFDYCDWQAQNENSRFLVRSLWAKRNLTTSCIDQSNAAFPTAELQVQQTTVRWACARLKAEDDCQLGCRAFVWWTLSQKERPRETAGNSEEVQVANFSVFNTLYSLVSWRRLWYSLFMLLYG